MAKDRPKREMQRNLNEEETRQLLAENGMVSNIGDNTDAFFDLFTKNASSIVVPPDENNVVIRPRGRATAALPVPELQNESQMTESYVDHLNFVTAGSQQTSKFAFVQNFISRFPFSKDEMKKESQINKFEASLKTALNDLILTEVATNTKKAFGTHVEKCSKIAGGIKVSYNFNNNKIIVEARGTFYGDETVCVELKGQTLEASIKKASGSDDVDYSDDFEIKIL